MKRQSWIPIFALAMLVFASSRAAADSLTYTFNVIPPSGAVSGGPGATVGWGYSITNNSSTEDLVTTDLNAGVFLYGAPSLLFLFPIVSPNATVSEDFLADTTGLYQETFLPGIPPGSIDTGVFTLSAEFCTNPTNPDTCRTTADALVGYSATASAETTVPEPGTVSLLAAGLLLLLRLRRRDPRR